MLALKGFFRKKSTKVYCAILCILTITIVLLFSFTKYCLNEINKEIYNKSVYLIISKNDYYDYLKQIGTISQVSRVLSLTPDSNCEPLKDNSYEGYDPSTNMIGIIKNNLTWTDFKYVNYDNIIIYPNSMRKEVKLKDNQIAISIPLNLKDEYGKYMSQLTGKTISFWDKDENNIEFVVSGFYYNNFSEMTISDEMFEELLDNSTYIYDIKILNHNDIFPVESELRNNKDINTIFTTIGSDFDSIDKYSNMVDTLNKFAYSILVVLFIILLIIIKNILYDEKKVIKINRLLGYNINQIKKNLVINLTTLAFIVIILSTLSTISINILLNIIYNLDLIVIDYYLLFNLYFAIIIVMIFFSLFYQFKINKYIKNG
ncbi:MAG: hypothetical protein PHW32_04470 [Bacilli bacterium]|nr:hypothetical protein [Bacilli bacterium]MDD4283009.1 hypothetical protein [Bacilli bacterium]